MIGITLSALDRIEFGRHDSIELGLSEYSSDDTADLEV